MEQHDGDQGKVEAVREETCQPAIVIGRVPLELALGGDNAASAHPQHDREEEMGRRWVRHGGANGRGCG